MKNILLLFALLCSTVLGLAAQNCTPVVSCSNFPITHCDLSSNNNELWNEAHWWSPVFLSHNLAEGPTDLSITAEDTCAAGLTIRYLLFLDLDGDDIQETVVNSANLPGFNTVNFNNYQNPNYMGGTPQTFDERPAAANQKYGFALQTTQSGNQTTAFVRWNTSQSPNTYLMPELPYGWHKIRWIVRNGLGEEVTCEQDFIVKDCKKPVVVCLNQFAVNIMPTGMIQLWASDLMQYTEDNATPGNKLQIAVRKAGVPDGQGNTTGFPRNADGTPQTSATFTCAEVGTNLLELWAIDLADNADFCQTFVLIQDNNGNCWPFNGARLKACVRCEQPSSNGLEDMTYTLNLQRPAQPPLVLTQNAECLKYFDTLPIPLGSSYTITPANDNNPLNGVSTYDGVLIAKHLLGSEPLDSPYKLIAADADRNGFVEANDIAEARWLILGIYTELPKNRSWRFVKRGYIFPNPNFPAFPPFPEKIKVENTTDTLVKEHEFTPIKIGDVNNSSACNSLMPNPEDRSAAALALPDLTLAEGETLDLPLRFAEAGEWLGFQVALRFDPTLLHIEQVSPSGKLPKFDASNFHQPEPGLLRAAWSNGQPTTLLADDALLSVRVRALAPVALRDAVTLRGERFAPEAYDAALQVRGLQLVFPEKTSGTSELSETQVFAPQPNPTAEGFSIPVRLAEAAGVQVQVSDLTGKVLYQSVLPYSAGSHLLAVPAAALPQSGVYAWRVQVGSAAKSGKVVRL